MTVSSIFLCCLKSIHFFVTFVITERLLVTPWQRCLHQIQSSIREGGGIGVLSSRHKASSIYIVLTFTGSEVIASQYGDMVQTNPLLTLFSHLQSIFSEIFLILFRYFRDGSDSALIVKWNLLRHNLRIDDVIVREGRTLFNWKGDSYSSFWRHIFHNFDVICRQITDWFCLTIRE